MTLADSLHQNDLASAKWREGGKGICWKAKSICCWRP